MGFYPELDHLSLDQLIDRFHGPPPDGPEYATAFYQEVASLMRQFDPQGLDTLLQELQRKNPNTERLRGMLLGLTFPPPTDPDRSRSVLTCLRNYLQDERPLIVADAIAGLQRMGAEEAADEVYALRHHPSPYVRANVLRFLGRLRPGLAWSILQDALRDEDKLVREAAIEVLVELVDRAVDVLESVAEEERDPDVRRLAEAALARTA
jgi:hypothetical protein